MNTTPDPNEPETDPKRKSACEMPGLAFCCPFVAVLRCFARGFELCADAMKPDAPKAR